ncbi:hypothetical protein NG798_23350 [Ancylothrix sp. C2]|uniref:hypothetical protein n=1 Tax=Ancylothrix sp. D3o TaxID=2953691 RepID=UPI0021BBA2EA|nr:hypothetical protein [Ancylothrix sp. D3o]MCT7952741.1 hypothetical protein [Ancylothrix sp. D3o]
MKKQVMQELRQCFKGALPIHQKEANRLYKQYGPKTALNYLRVAGNVPPAPKRPQAKRKNPAIRKPQQIECPHCKHPFSLGVGGGHCTGGRYRTYKCESCLRCHRIFLD